MRAFGMDRPRDLPRRLPRTQVRLSFPTLDAARAYAASQGLDYHIVAPVERKLKIQAYADNFR
jgi:hypothetical protein